MSRYQEICAQQELVKFLPIYLPPVICEIIFGYHSFLLCGSELSRIHIQGKKVFDDENCLGVCVFILSTTNSTTTAVLRRMESYWTYSFFNSDGCQHFISKSLSKVFQESHPLELTHFKNLTPLPLAPLDLLRAVFDRRSCFLDVTTFLPRHKNPEMKLWPVANETGEKIATVFGKNPADAAKRCYSIFSELGFLKVEEFDGDDHSKQTIFILGKNSRWFAYEIRRLPLLKKTFSDV